MLVGAGISAMHYVGMWGLRGYFHVSWDYRYVLASILLAGIFAMAAITTFDKIKGIKGMLAAAALFSAGTWLAHFTGMSAATLVPDPGAVSSGTAIPSGDMAIVISAVIFLIVALGQIGAQFDRMMVLARIAEAERQKMYISELEATRTALNHALHEAGTANAAKTAFLASMSHELRTPLNGVLGMVQALGADELTGLQRDRVDVIRRSSESLLAVLNDLLDLSKIEASVLKLELVEFDLEHLIRGCAAAYRPLAEKKGLSFDFQIAGDVRGRYRGDSARIRRILYSLADNAVKFTEAGGVTLWVTREQGRTVFRICDTGIGISRGDLGRLFEGFFQADATLARRYGGAGIGLAICSELAGLMGGAVQAWSEPGRGSTFTLDLPLERVREALPDDVGDARAAPRRPSELRVLAAEDNPVNQLVLKTLLEPAGITPTLVLNGRDAVAAWESQPWDVILMDIQMPEMDGVEAARIIRQRERDTGRARTPIVAVTANAMTHQLVEYEAAGMDGVVAKPVDCASLLQAIERALAGGDPKQIAAA